MAAARVNNWSSESRDINKGRSIAGLITFSVEEYDRKRGEDEDLDDQPRSLAAGTLALYESGSRSVQALMKSYGLPLS